jgi:acyl carrier protein
LAKDGDTGHTKHRMDTTKLIRQFITTNFYVADPAALRGGASLLDLGIVDSTGVLEIISYVEKTFGVEVDDDEMIPDNLECIDKIAAFVARKSDRITAV